MGQLVHHFWHGDSTLLIPERFTPGRKAIKCVVTDPPFGTDNMSRSAVTHEGKQAARKIANDATPEIAMQTFINVMEALVPHTADDCDFYVFTAYQVLKEWMDMVDAWGPHFGWVRKAVLVWEKDGPGQGDLDYCWGTNHEFILFLKKGKKILNGKRRAGVFHVPQVRPTDLIHPHEKPTQLLEMFIKASTDEGDLVVDPFGGSASTVRASMACGRSCIAIEYNEENWQKGTASLAKGAGLFG